MNNDIKGKVKEYYGSIAKKVDNKSKCSCGCGTSCCGDMTNSNLYSSEYIADLPVEAVNASLGCANPITFAELKEGEIALDLGSGGGIDVFIASKYVGKSGKVFGLDMTDEMLVLANKNKVKMGINNVEFIKGYIEDIPMKDEAIDVILSNCVINLCEDKEKALKEVYRVLKTGGRLAIADVVILKDVPQDIKQNMEMWVGCIAGALPTQEYIQILKKVGFKDVEILPVNVYTKEIIESIVNEKKLNDLYENMDKNMIDGAFAGAYVKAIK
ncbi:MAG: arsenite S-adenosylmethyltransferase [Clostridiales bacterium]|nr:arsenite S-adenosylmethyltransferase [Clostridiales bacterium]